jgi:sugar/nucleoside kinase (ribokinase family)
MRILICGHGSFDYIHPTAGPERRSPGGVFITIAAAAQAAPEMAIAPIITVGENEYDEVRRWLEKFSNVDGSGIVVTKESTHTVHYYQQSKGGHTRCTTSPAEPIPIKAIKPKLAGVDGILITMSSGFDITLETLDEVRIETQSKSVAIHLDVHNLVLGSDEGKGRPYRPVPTWRQWFFHCDTVQLNEVEAAAITPDHMIEEHFVKQALALGLTGLLITRDENGVSVFQQEHKKMIAENIAPPQVKGIRDSIGCGDVFAGVFLTRYLTTHNIIESARDAAMVAGWSASFTSPEDLFSIQERLKEHPLS